MQYFASSIHQTMLCFQNGEEFKLTGQHYCHSADLLNLVDANNIFWQRCSYNQKKTNNIVNTP